MKFSKFFNKLVIVFGLIYIGWTSLLYNKPLTEADWKYYIFAIFLTLIAYIKEYGKQTE